MKFIGRQRELQALEHFHNTPEAGLLILFGRRRVGKTTLLVHFMENLKISTGFYWMATTHNTTYQLRDFTQALFRYDPRFASALRLILPSQTGKPLLTIWLMPWPSLIPLSSLSLTSLPICSVMILH